MLGQLQKIENLTIDSMSQLSARVASDQTSLSKSGRKPTGISETIRWSW